MPELPEVETTRLGLLPALTHRRFAQTTIRAPRLRWPIDPLLPEYLADAPILGVRRRAKYILMDTLSGSLIVHLGMTGSLRVYPEFRLPQKHDHVDWALDDGAILRLHDPRRFGAVLWQPANTEHALFAHLGAEPLDEAFDADHLHARLKTQTRAIKLALMDQKVVVGVGNIYANEALFQAALSPARAANTLDLAQCQALVAAVKSILAQAIKAGGSTLRNYVDSQGKAGAFQLRYAVYGRASQPCVRCGAPIVRVMLGQRSTFYCRHCQQ